MTSFRRALGLFRQDAQRWVEPQSIADPSRVTIVVALKLLYHYPPLRAMLLFRLGSWLKHSGVPFLPGMIQREIQLTYGLEIWVGADIGGGLYVPHPFGTVIAVRRMGQNCNIIAAATLGMRTKWAFPDIEDEVYIGAGARVLGGIHIGNRAVIGANAVVIDDVPDDATVVGIPARVTKVKGRPVEDRAEAGVEGWLPVDARSHAGHQLEVR